MTPQNSTAEIDAYVRAKQVALGSLLAERKRVYLDLNFWIIARDAGLGLRTDAPSLKLHHLLRRGVRQGRLFCPIGDSFFMELLKQPYSEDRRIGTALVVDELSLGVAMLPSQHRIGTEIYQLFHQLLDRPEPLIAMQKLVWTKVCHILGPNYPVHDDLPSEVMISLQKGFIDLLWKASLTEMITQVGEEIGENENYKALTDETNWKRDQYNDDITSYDVAYETELRGGIEACEDLATDIFCDIGEKSGYGQAPSRADRGSLRNVACNTLLHAFRKRNAGATVRTLHIEASLHASLRYDKKRRFKPNDWHDFHHAAAALAYCDVFLTEGPLHELVARPQLGLLAINGCQVASTLDDAISLLGEIR